MDLYEFKGPGGEGRGWFKDEGAARQWLGRHFKDDAWSSQNDGYVSILTGHGLKAPKGQGLLKEGQERELEEAAEGESTEERSVRESAEAGGVDPVGSAGDNAEMDSGASRRRSKKE